MKYILASKSPRRSKILKKAGFNIKIIPSNIDESKISIKLKPESYCIKLSNLKSQDIAKNYKNHTIIGADTIVFLKNKILNKPKSFNEAKQMLTILSNNTHKVLTGVSIININLGIDISFYESTNVTFYKLSDNEIDDYINRFKPYDKSGGYGIQDASNIFIKKIDGSYENILGFPISKFYQLMKDISCL